MRAVVTGCAGFIGYHLTKQLLNDGATVVGIDCLAPTYGTALRRAGVSALSSHPRFEFIEGDVNAIDLKPFVGDADVVFHLAARPGVRASWDDFSNVSRANIQGTQRVLDAISTSPRTKLVFASSSSVYGSAETFPTKESAQLHPISPYGVSKASCEALLGAYASQHDLDVASLRYFTVYGPRQRSDMAFMKWIRAAFRDEPLPIYGDGSAVRSFTYVSDIVDATLAVGSMVSSGHQVLNVAGETSASVNDALALIEQLVDRPLKLEYQATAKGDPPRTGGSTEKLMEVVSWRPQWGLSDGLEAQVDWVRATGAE